MPAGGGTAFVSARHTHIERLNRETRRHARIVGMFPSTNFALMLVTIRLEYVAKSE